jgi:hypothetical protein
LEDIEFEDEMRVGTRTDLGRRWMPSGARPVGQQKIGYEYLYLYVSLKPLTGEVFALFLCRVWIKSASASLPESAANNSSAKH